MDIRLHSTKLDFQITISSKIVVEIHFLQSVYMKM